jgi:hypothetical protein
VSKGEHASQKAAAVLKFGASLCAMAAAGLLVLPLLRGEVGAQPRDITPPLSLPAEEETRAGATAGEAAESADPSIQESRTAFQGAILSLESRPPGASVRVNGTDQGETPVMVGLECVPGKPVVIVFSLRGFESTTHRTACPRDALITVKAQLKQSTRGTAGKR